MENKRLEIEEVKIFISYRRYILPILESLIQFIENYLKAEISEIPYKFLIDRNDIEDDKVQEEIARLIDNESDIFLSLITADYERSNYCRFEMNKAINKRKGLTSKLYKIFPININLDREDQAPFELISSYKFYPDIGEPLCQDLSGSLEGALKGKAYIIIDIAEKLKKYIIDVYEGKRETRIEPDKYSPYIFIRKRNKVIDQIETLVDPVDDFGRPLERIPNTEEDILGLFALERAWGLQAPNYKKIAEHLNFLDSLRINKAYKKILMAAERQGWFREGDHFKDQYLGVGIAADHLVRWFEKDYDTGSIFMHWALGNLNKLSEQRRLVIKSIIGWWDKAINIISEWREQCYQECKSSYLPPDDKIQSLNCMNACDCILNELELVSTIDEAPSISWAYELGLTEYLPDLFEKLGEKRIKVIQRHLRRLEEMGKEEPLARWLKQKVEAGIIEGELEGSTGLAIRCSLKDARAEDLELLHNNLRAQHLWLNLLTPPLNHKQVEVLTHLIETSQSVKQKEYILTRGAKHLAAQPNLIQVWEALKDMQIYWIDKLSDKELRQENFKKLKEMLDQEKSVTEIAQNSRDYLDLRYQKALKSSL